MTQENITRMIKEGYLTLPQKPLDMAEHGLYHAANHEFFHALLEVIALLRMECLLRECHPIHEKLVELSAFVHAEHCQDFTSTIYPVDV